MEITTYQDALAFIHGRQKFKKIPSLKRMQQLLKSLGNPQEKLKFIHITGTNGKGSTTAYTRDLLLNAGFSVGTFISPFITKFNERIMLNDVMISDAELLAEVLELAPHVAKLDQQDLGPTEFEIVTALMFNYFAKKRPDYVVLEVGIGGLYDSTNVITPAVSVITTVALDHGELLGTTLAQVAKHKAGIIKKQVPVVLGQLPTEALEVIETTAQAKQAKVYALGTDFEVKSKKTSVFLGEQFSYQGLERNFIDLKTSLLGTYQPKNAALAITAVLLLAKQEGWQLTSQIVKNAIAKTKWPGRMEVVNDEPLIILDGAHNLAAIEELDKTLKQHFKNYHVQIIFWALADKQPQQMLAKLAQVKHCEVYLTPFASHRPTFAAQELAQKFKMQAFENWPQALQQALDNLQGQDLILFTGSLYFISEVRQYFKEGELSWM